MVAISLSVVGVCWWVSPTRTAIGLIGAGLFSLIALRRSRRRVVAPAHRLTDPPGGPASAVRRG